MFDPVQAAVLVSLQQRQLMEQARHSRQIAEIRRARPRRVWWRLLLQRRSGAAGRAAAVTTA
jgi:hypothetical protein